MGSESTTEFERGSSHKGQVGPVRSHDPREPTVEGCGCRLGTHVHRDLIGDPMCQSQAEGGRRCYAHQRQRVDKLEQSLAETSPDTAEHEEISSRLETARADLIQTRTGLQEHITERTAAGGSYDAEQLTANIHRYVADSPTGKPLTLPGGSFRVTRGGRAHLPHPRGSRGRLHHLTGLSRREEATGQ